MEVSVILATYNRAASLRVTLESLLKVEVPAGLTWELLVIDNNSSDATREAIDEFSKRAGFCVRYIFEGRQGRSAALNAGITQAQGQIIAFTDDDVILHPEWLLHLKATFDRFDCAAVAGRVVPLWSHPKPEWLEMEDQLAITRFELGDEIREIHFPPLGANSAFRKDVFERHGVFRLDLGVSGNKHTITCDDTEFGERLVRAGEKIVYCPTAIVYHPVDPERATKKYFLSWYFYNGVSLTRTAGLPAEGVFYFGVPRWMYREFAANLAKWFLTFEAKRRFHRKLKTYRSAGTIVECHRLSRARTAAAQPRISAVQRARGVRQE